MAEPDDGLILESIKAPLGLAPDYGPFDVELLIHINSAVANLRQLNVGPDAGLFVTKDTTWSALLVNDTTRNLENVKMYIYLTVKMVFDTQSLAAHHIAAYEKLINETVWRINHSANPPEDNMLPVDEEDVNVDV